MIIKALLDGGLLHGDCMTVTGKTLAENHKDVVFPTDQDVIYPVASPISPTGGVVGLRGNLAPDGAIVKVAGHEATCASRAPRCASTARRRPSPRSMRAPTRPATSSSSATRVRRAAPACARCCRPRRRIYGQGMGEQGGADHRWPVLRRHARLLHRPCRARGGGGRADRAGAERRPHHHRRRRRARSTCWCRKRSWPRAGRRGSRARPTTTAGAIWKYAQLVGPAHLGAVTHPGGEAETHMYADQ